MVSIGHLNVSYDVGPFWVRRFYETLRGLGDVEGTNLIVERFSAEGRSDRFEIEDLPIVAEVADLAHLWICEQAELIA